MKIKGDQIEVFEILNGYEHIDSNMFFEIKEGKIIRGHASSVNMFKNIMDKYLVKAGYT